MNEFNTWHDNQPRSKNNTFLPKWNSDTIEWIIDKLNQMVDVLDIQVSLVKEYKISLASASLWIEMSRRIMIDMQNGLSFGQALDRDKERRNLFRRKNKYLPNSSKIAS